MTRYSPLWLQQQSYAASVDRRIIGMLGSTGALPPVSGCAVTVSSGMTVNVAPGTVVVPSSNATGSVLCSSDAVEPVTLSAAPASGSNRYDLIICQARGNDLDGGANNDFLFTTVTGTAAASPAVPAVPNNAYALAQIYVPGASASVTAGNILDRRWLWIPGQRVAGFPRAADFPFSGTGETDAAMSLTIPDPTGRKVRLELAWGASNGSISNDQCFLRVKEGATKINEAKITFVGFFGAGQTMTTTFAPSSGPHTYAIVGAGNAANNYNVASNANQPFAFNIYDAGF